MTDKLSRYLLPNLPYAMVFWFTNKFGEAYRLAPGADFLKKLTGCIKTVNAVLSKPAPSFHPQDLLVGLVGAVIIYAMVY